MSSDCGDANLQCYFDNELDALGAMEFERHLEQCSQCVVRLETLKYLRSVINGADLYRRTPPPLREKVLRSLGFRRYLSFIPARTFWRAATAAALLLVAYTGWHAFSFKRPDDFRTGLTAEVVDAHLRSLQPGHLNDIISSDQHTVKPWFNGKLDFSPPVRDFADRGFSLQGGRLDVIQGRTIAALVYGHRKHLVNLFLWPTTEPDEAPRVAARQGYHVLDWRHAGMEWCIVSDAGPSDLLQLQTMLTE
jgi:anti-sigma factor RsiW